MIMSRVLCSEDMWRFIDIYDGKTKKQEIILLLIVSNVETKNQGVAGRVDSRWLHKREPEVGREWSAHEKCCSLEEPLNFLNNVTKITLPKGKTIWSKTRLQIPSWAYQVTCLPTSLTTQVQPLEPTWWTERTYSCKVFSDFHMCTVSFMDLPMYTYKK